MPTKDYVQTPDGTWVHPDTPPEVIAILAEACRTHRPIRFWHGDAETGRDWMETYDCYGYVSRSTGPKHIYILLKQNNSMGGGAILTHCIVKIIWLPSKQIAWVHPKYKEPKFTIWGGVPSDPGFEVRQDGKVEARFKTWASAKRWVDFMQGRRARP